MTWTLYDFRNGPFDQYLGELIGKTPAAREERKIRWHVPLVKGRSLIHGYVQDREVYLRTEHGRCRTFLYLANSSVSSYGLPKRHYFMCEKVREGLPFVMSNMDLVDIHCRETGQFYQEVSLEVCGYCRGIYYEKTARELTGDSYEEFILGMEEAEATRTTETGSKGYAVNWQQISTAYRKTRHYTCEECGLQITDPEHQHFIHAHHIDHDKRNNRRSNLQALCIHCHSQVDGLHIRNFSTQEQQLELAKFRQIFNP